MTIDKKTLDYLKSNGNQITNIDFSDPEYHVAHTLDFQGFSANNQHTSVIMKSKLSQQDIEDIQNTNEDIPRMKYEEELKNLMKAQQDKLNSIVESNEVLSKANETLLEQVNVLKQEMESAKAENERAEIISKAKSLNLDYGSDEEKEKGTTKLVNIVKSLSVEDGEFLIKTLLAVKDTKTKAENELFNGGFYSQFTEEDTTPEIQRGVQKSGDNTLSAINKQLGITTK